MENQNIEEIENEDVKESFTKEEVDKLLADYEKERESYADKRVNSAIEKKRSEWAEEAEALKEQAMQEASMTEAEKQQAQFENERKAFEEERAKFERAKLESNTLKLLSKDNLPTGFAEFLISEDEKSTQENIQIFKELWESQLEKVVTDRLGGNTPKTVPASNKQYKTISKAEFNKLPYEKRMEMLADNPDLMNNLK